MNSNPRSEKNSDLPNTFSPNNEIEVNKVQNEEQECSSIDAKEGKKTSWIKN